MAATEYHILFKMNPSNILKWIPANQTTKATRQELLEELKEKKLSLNPDQDFNKKKLILLINRVEMEDEKKWQDYDLEIKEAEGIIVGLLGNSPGNNASLSETEKSNPQSTASENPQLSLSENPQAFLQPPPPTSNSEKVPSNSPPPTSCSIL